MRDVYAKAGISFKDAGFVEAHGTGTKIGDPIEARAIYNVFGEGRTKRLPLYIGSVKTNVGHLENASGIISVIKATMMLEKGFILPNVNFEKANESIPLDEWNLKVPTSLRSWPAHKKYISINNFGFGGSNAHCVLQRPALNPDSVVQEKSDGVHKLFVLSGHSEESAKARAKQLGIYAEQHPEVFQKRLVRDLAYTLGERRAHMSWRTALTASCCNEVVQALNDVGTKPTRSSKPPKIAFVFTGQGAQWHAMGRELMDSHAVFADTMRAADDCLARLGADFSLLEELGREKGETRVNQAHLSQPACTAIQLGLVRLFSSWGIEPQAVVGHSSGEIAAAFAAGVISLDAAMTTAYQRGQVTLRMKAEHPELRGGMLAVGASPTDVRKIIKTMSLQGAAVACENSPGSTTVSGNVDAVEQLAAELESRGIFNRKLLVDVAYHSSHMELVAQDYRRAIEGVTASDPSDVAFFSSLHGKALERSSMLTAEYWTDNLVKPVLFSPALQALCAEAKPTVLVEIGPHAALEGPIKQILRDMGEPAAGIKYCASLVRNQDATVAALTTAGALFAMGQSLNFDKVNNTTGGSDRPNVVDDFAPYPWTHERYWVEPRQSLETRIKPFGRHDLLGLLTTGSTEHEHSWRNVISTDDVPWLREHKMQTLTTFPLAGYLSMVVEAAAQRASLRRVAFDRFCMREVQATAPLIMNDGDEYEMTLTLRRYAEGTRSYSNEWDEFQISSWAPGRGWIEHCRGLVAVRKPSSNPISSPAHAESGRRRLRATERCTDTVALEPFYAELDGRGASYGPLFQIRDKTGLHCCDEYCHSRVEVPDTAAAMPFDHETPYVLPPALIDLLFQQTFAILGAGRHGMPALYMPNAIKHLEFGKELPNKAGQALQVVCEGRPSKNVTAVDFAIDAWQPETSDRPVLSMRGFTMTPVHDENADEAAAPSVCYKLQWEDLVNKAQANGVNGHANGTNGINGNGTNGINGHANGNALEADFAAPVVIVSDKTDTDPMVRSLMDLLVLKTGASPTVCPLDRLVASDKICIVLYELDGPLLAGINADGFDRLQRLILTASALLWVGTGISKNAAHPDKALSQGLLRTVRSETGKLAATLDLDPASPLDDGARCELIIQALKKVLASEHEDGPGDFEFAEHQGRLAVPRVVEDGDMDKLVQRQTKPSAPYLQPYEQENRRLEIAIGTYGALDSLYFRDEVEQPLGDDDVEIKVAATGMNFKDVVITMGQVGSPYLGVECSGTVARVGANVASLAVGDRVCAMCRGAYGTYTRCKATSAAVMPAHMTMEEGASIPVVYSTAYYGLVDIAHLEAGDKILIHAASGGVGQAAIQLAQMIGADIFATVGSPDKKRLIMDKYGIPEDRIFYSRDSAFGPAVREATGGAGVDVVINSLAGELLRESWECLAPFGRFVEIGKRDITSNTRLDMGQFEHNVTFSSVDLTLVASERPKVMGRVLGAVMKLLGSKQISAIEPITVLGISGLESALRTLQSGKSTGKLIISPRPGEQVKVSPQPRVSSVCRADQGLQVTHRRASGFLKQNATYIIIGGTGGLGRSMAKWMVHRGARHVVLLSRNGRKTAELDRLAQECSQLGATIHVRSCDVVKEASVKAVVDECAKSLPPVQGLIHAAMVLRDVLFEKMTFDDYNQVVEAKLAGTWNFHRALAGQPLDFFVVLSSVAGIVGNRGQAAYAAANTFLDAFVQHRTQQGLPATSIDLTAVEGVGYLAENAARQSEILQTLAGSTFGEAEVLALVEASICGHVSRFSNSQVITGLNFSGASLPFYADDAKFSHLRDAVLATTQGADGDGSQAASAQDELTRAATYEQAVQGVAARVQEKLCAILMLQAADMDAGSSVKSYGLDSLNAIELRNWIGKEYSSHLQVLELLTSGTIGDLAALVLKKTKIKHVQKAA